jgi:restriction system protein
VPTRSSKWTESKAKKVVLIDGEQLCWLMIDHKIGVTVRQTYEICDVSQDFFDADEL